MSGSKRQASKSSQHAPPTVSILEPVAGLPDGMLTNVGCPDCRGVLETRRVGKQGHLEFRCRVGHVFSDESLIMAKEEQIEDCLWAAVEIFEEVAALHHEFAERLRGSGTRDLATAYEGRAELARHNGGIVRGVIAHDGPAATTGPRGKRHRPVDQARKARS